MRSQLFKNQPLNNKLFQLFTIIMNNFLKFLYVFIKKRIIQLLIKIESSLAAHFGGRYECIFKSSR
ncbi:hypothetical protein BC962_2411 [Gillisia mitskevichiae]|uniref:Uncharacterized protein n=1 Tax=Gillisia mitskevichiae TaxID=270921 RepID=A0A495PPN4_9FLAO|nr:hypothetical protein BC962_2411 [Gillisia mitskevichiae]